MDKAMFKRLVDGQDKTASDLVDIKVTLAEHGQILSDNTRILDEHQKRTKISEDRLLQMETAFTSHISFLKGAIWIGSGLVTVAGVVATYIRFFS